MTKPVAIVTRKWPKDNEDRLKELFDVTLNESDKPFTADELKTALQNCDVLMPTVTDKITADILSVENRRAKMIGNFGVGFNHIDIAKAKELGITVSNTPSVLTDCTADIAMLLMLGVARRGSEGEFHVRKKEWSGWRPTHMMGTKITGKTLGLIGMGRIAQAMAHKAHHGFKMEILFYDPYVKSENLDNLKANSCESIEELLSKSDFVSLHCPSTKETQGLINYETLKKMKKSAYLINTARGDIVVESDLVKALKDDVIKGAGLDVYQKEPEVNEELLKLKNVFLLPHLGSATEETREAMGMRVLNNIQAFFNGDEPNDRVV